MMPLRTPQMLKKSGINKGNPVNYLAFIFRIVQAFYQRQLIAVIFIIAVSLLKFNFTYFSHHYDNCSMFQNVPESSMFQGFVSTQVTFPRKSSQLIAYTL